MRDADKTKKEARPPPLKKTQQEGSWSRSISNKVPNFKTLKYWPRSTCFTYIY
jgi:hypothetical protein